MTSLDLLASGVSSGSPTATRFSLEDCRLGVTSSTTLFARDLWSALLCTGFASSLAPPFLDEPIPKFAVASMTPSSFNSAWFALIFSCRRRSLISNTNELAQLPLQARRYIYYSVISSFILAKSALNVLVATVRYDATLRPAAWVVLLPILLRDSTLIPPFTMSEVELYAVAGMPTRYLQKGGNLT
jgi:hypothetical protein